MQLTPIVLALVSNKKKGALTQLGVPLKVKFVLGVIWIVLKRFIAIKGYIMVITSS